MAIQKSARAFAMNHKIGLGRMENGHYYIAQSEVLSMYPTAKSAIVMMKRHLKVA